MDWIEAAYFVKMPSGPPAQGDVWTDLPCAYANPTQCMGIIITPRCDLAHDKTPVVNYLPVVSVDNFMAAQGGRSLVGQEISRCQDGLRTTAGQLKMLEILDLGVPPEKIIQLAYDYMQQETDPKIKERINQQILAFRGYADRIQELQSRLESATLKFQELAPYISEKSVRKYKLDLVRNTIADLHFLPPCPPLIIQPSVILLRYVTTCSMALLNIAGMCINQNHWEQMCETNLVPQSEACPLKPERLVRLKSPYFECLMARFAALFGRVGVRDFDYAQLEAFITTGVNENVADSSSTECS